MESEKGGTFVATNYLNLLYRLRSYKSTATSSRKKYKSRRSAVQSILKDLQNDFDNNVEAVNKQKTKVQTESASGFYNLSNIVSQNSTIGSIVELDPDVDKNLSSAMESLNSELSKIDEKIEFLDGRISELNTLISKVTRAMMKGEDISIAFMSNYGSDISFTCSW